MSEEPSLMQYVASEEPLSPEAVKFILNYQGEPLYLDCKETFNPDSNKDWLKIAKDIYGFANTSGGYLVFGKEDETWENKSLPEDVAATLSNPDNIHKKINRHIEPNISNVTSVRIDAPARMVIIHIPEAVDCTHVVTRNATLKDGDKDKTLLREGEVYVRHSGGTSLIRPEDLERMIDKRVDRQVRKIFENLSKSPRKYSLVKSAEAEPSEDVLKFRLTGAREAQPVAGMPSTVVPESDEEELMEAIALYKKDSNHKPCRGFLLRLYSRRNEINLTGEMLTFLVELCIIQEIPCLCWAWRLDRDTFVKSLSRVIRSSRSRLTRLRALKLAPLLGKRVFDRLAALTSASDKPGVESIKSRFMARGKILAESSMQKIRSKKEEAGIEAQATELASNLSRSRKAVLLDRLRGLDWEIYSQKCLDNFQKRTKPKQKALATNSGR